MKYNAELFLTEDNYLRINKILIKRLKSLEGAHFLTNLLSVRGYLRIKGMLPKDEWFFCTQESIEEALCITPYQQNRVIRLLEDFRVLKTSMRGLPCRKHFWIDDDLIHEFYSRSEET